MDLPFLCSSLHLPPRKLWISDPLPLWIESDGLPSFWRVSFFNLVWNGNLFVKLFRKFHILSSLSGWCDEWYETLIEYGDSWLKMSLFRPCCFTLTLPRSASAKRGEVTTRDLLLIRSVILYCTTRSNLADISSFSNALCAGKFPSIDCKKILWLR